MHAIGDFIVLFCGCFLDIQCFDDLFLIMVEHVFGQFLEYLEFHP